MKKVLPLKERKAVLILRSEGRIWKRTVPTGKSPDSTFWDREGDDPVVVKYITELAELNRAPKWAYGE
ncbi:hypothetical protein N9112_00435 [bacterium]|nr:hypothetical protein [bacterium]